MSDQPDSLESLIAERDELKRHCERLQSLLTNIGYPPGHFYSPVVDLNDPFAAAAVRTRVEAESPRGVEINTAAMKALLTRLAEHHRAFPFPRHQNPEFRFWFDNPFFGCHDASVLFSMLLEFRPHRIVEVGCGYSSCLILDTNERFFDGKLNLTLIDPALDDLRNLFGARGSGDAHLYSARVQNVPLEVFARLEADDILFIDSSHILKTGSDVNHYLFEILPILKPGVLIHVHDILYPFEYPAEWMLKDKRSWNEAYALHGFLEYNSAFEIICWNNFVSHRLRNDLAALMPLCLENEGGSIWLRRNSA